MASVLTASVSSGNTTPSEKKICARNYQLTLNEIEHYASVKEYLTTLKTFQFLESCKEIAPTTGHEHIHIYVQFNKSIRLSIKKLHGAHIEVCRGSPQQNIKYIEKDGNILDKIGVARLSGIPCIREVENMTYDEIKELPAHLSRIAIEIKNKAENERDFEAMLESIKNDELKAPEINYIIGLPGNGKTYGAYKQALSKYDVKEIGRISIHNNFFNIENERAKCFVIEEFRPSQLHPSNLLQFTDKYGYQAPIKGGFKYLRPETIYICSVKNPIHLYEKDELNEQFTRRITHYYHADDKVLNEITIEDLSIYDY